jgi:hypothetical protein
MYTLAVSRLAIVGEGAAPYQMGFWSIRESGFVAGLKQRGRKGLDPLDAVVLEALDQTLDALIPRLAAGIRDGKFPVYNTDEQCTRFCPYSTVCRVGQIRPIQDLMDKRFDL